MDGDLIVSYMSYLNSYKRSKKKAFNKIGLFFNTSILYQIYSLNKRLEKMS